MAWTLWLKKLILPPGGPLLVAVTGLLLAAGGSDKLGLAVVAAGLMALYGLSVPWLGRRLLHSLDHISHFDPASPGARAAGAIVVLDAGRRCVAEQRGGDNVSPFTLERLATGAELHRRLGLPVLVSGDGSRELMAEVLDRCFGVPVRWVEPRSRNTRENAVCSARLLRAAGIDRVVLVTHYWHMRRAAAAFRHTGLEVLPAATGFAGKLRSEVGLMALIPNARVLFSSYLVLHEWLGMLWYRIRYRHGC